MESMISILHNYSFHEVICNIIHCMESTTSASACKTISQTGVILHTLSLNGVDDVSLLQNHFLQWIHLCHQLVAQSFTI